MTVYVWVSTDEYRLPKYVAYSLKELVKVSGKPVNTIASMISKHAKGKAPNSPFIRVEVDNDE